MSNADLWKEFKGFALKGNVVDLAVAVVVGNAFGALVNSLVKDVIMQAMLYILPAQATYKDWKLGRIYIGAFLGELLNFVVIAGVMFFIMVKLMQLLRRMGVLRASVPDMMPCPFCLSTIPIKAKKCAHCTADLPVEP
jgi:large conductance mechanosensitive channel